MLKKFGFSFYRFKRAFPTYNIISSIFYLYFLANVSFQMYIFQKQFFAFHMYDNTQYVLFDYDCCKLYKLC